MKRSFSEEDYDILSPYEIKFKCAIESSYITGLTQHDKEVVFGVYTQLTGLKRNINCSGCVLSVYKTVGKYYFEFKDKLEQTLLGPIDVPNENNPIEDENPIDVPNEEENENPIVEEEDPNPTSADNNENKTKEDEWNKEEHNSVPNTTSNRTSKKKTKEED